MENLAQGVRPVPGTRRRGVAVVEEGAKNETAADRIDVFEIEQFVALNLYEWGQFSATGNAGNESAVAKLAERYNRIVETAETDPSLKIRIRQ